MMARVTGGVVALLLSTSVLAAQQPQGQAPDSHGRMGGRDNAQMMTMDSLNHRLDSLAGRMNRTTGNQKVQAMADVINELVSQRKMMQDRMHRMMERGGMMGTMDSSTTGSKATVKPESAATDSTDHAAHHPAK
ncbi:MAG TPA: hypothetical protein VHR41_10870 [Gemmatimonadales bacterium]|jgi:TolA-binding protein|nr:hypothetical protein [Gemmatimonadales bacterium]